MTADWLDRWEQGNIGWHEAEGNKQLRKWWQVPETAKRVLVPLCGKTMDLRWLADRGHEVTGVELSSIAVEAFFEEQALAFHRSEADGLSLYRAADLPISIYCGDYFAFEAEPFDALYDRAALIALPPAMRPGYAAHTRRLLRAGAPQLLITLHYDQQRVAGPPFSVSPEEVAGYWPALEVVQRAEAINGVPPKFREAGLTTVTETVWSGIA